MDLFETCNVMHTHRECNFVADALAKISVTLARGTTVFCSPPSHIS